jgi:hypothetical protein
MDALKPCWRNNFSQSKTAACSTKPLPLKLKQKLNQSFR